jgi:hypothetical protein
MKTTIQLGLVYLALGVGIILIDYKLLLLYLVPFAFILLSTTIKRDRTL